VDRSSRERRPRGTVATPGRRIARGKSKGEEGYGRGQARIAWDDDVLLDEERMVEVLLECLHAPDYEPPTLPSVALRLMQLAQEPDVGFADVVALLEQDPMLAGRVLRIVQSPVYSGAMKTGSLHEALVRLGLRTLRDIVMEIAMNTRVFKSQDYAETMDLLRAHSGASAHLAKLVSRYTPIDGEYAFLGGLLHDVGIAGTLLALSHDVAKGPDRRPPPDLIAIWPALDRVHVQAGELLADHWQLPPDLKLAIGAHHQVLIQGHAHPMAATVAVANELAHDHGFGVLPKEDTVLRTMNALERDCVSSHTRADRSGEKTLEHAREALRLGDEQLRLIEADAVELVAKLGSDGERG